MKAKRNGHITFKSVIDIWGMQIIHIFHGDWIDFRSASSVVLVCSTV